MKHIISRQGCPPIPTTDFDWESYFDGAEEYGPYGWGNTKERSIEALLDEPDTFEQWTNANHAELVRRWNSHDALLEACKAWVDWDKEHDGIYSQHNLAVKRLIAQSESAIKLTEEA